MTNQLDEAVPIEKVEDLNNLKKYQKIRYTCKNCGVIVERLYLGSRRSIIERFLCQKCNNKQTLFERYGVNNVMELDNVKEKVFNTNVERYGNKCSLRNPNVYKKAKNTWNEKYGVINPFNTEQTKQKARKASQSTRYHYKGMSFDSSWEIAFYIYHTDNGIIVEHEPVKIPFLFEGKTYNYVPDFRIGSQLFEIKGNQFLDKDGTWKDPYTNNNSFVKIKYSVAIHNNVKILYWEDIKRYVEYVKTKYGDDFLRNCRNKKHENNKTTSKSRKIRVLCLETDTIYNSLTEAAKALGLNRKSIKRNCICETESYNGLHFKMLM